jgi:hypothetical protein
VSLELEEYERLHALAQSQRPRMKLSYVVAYAIRQLLQRADSGQLPLDFGRPVPPRRS